MSVLINELKSEHEFLVEEFSKVKEMGIISKDAKKILFGCKDALLAHLKKEDEKLYPVLNKAAKTDESLKSNLDNFAKNMDEISKAALGFFDKYEQESEGIDFAKDLGGLMGTLASRIRREETILYKKYDELT